MLSHIKKIPLIFILFISSIILLLLSNIDFFHFNKIVNKSFGNTIGYFFLIIYPSFILAETLQQYKFKSSSKRVVLLSSPLIGAIMQCPDTAYVSLSSLADKKQKPYLALSCYIGFKLLCPAGPLLLGSQLNFFHDGLIYISLLTFLVVHTLHNIIFFYYKLNASSISNTRHKPITLRHTVTPYLPFIFIFTAITFKFLFEKLVKDSTFEILLHPAVIMIIASTMFTFITAHKKLDIIYRKAFEKTSKIICIMGIASLFSASVNHMFSLEKYITLYKNTSFELLLFSVFCLSALIKTLQGSSMAAFAFMGSILVNIQLDNDILIVKTIMVAALGSLVTILPNDSYYWLIKETAFPHISHKVFITRVTIYLIFLSLAGFMATITLL